MPEYHPLSVQQMTGAVSISYPASPKSVTLESPALDVMTDLRRIHAIVIEPDATIKLANSYMIRRGVRALLVLTKDQTLEGVLSAADILGEKPMRFVQEQGVKHDDILVSNVMCPLNRIKISFIEEVQHSKVGHIIASFHDTGRQHILVMENSTDGKPSICGIFSFTHIERQLGTTIPSTKVAGNFAEIEKSLIEAN